MSDTAPPGGAGRRGVALYGLRLFVLAALYVGGGWIGLGLAHYQENATLIWPPTGLCLAALLVYGRSLWPGVLLGSLTLAWATDTAPALAISFAVGNTLEAVVGALLLVHVFEFRATLERIRDVVSLLVVGGMWATLISAAVGVTALRMFGELAPEVSDASIFVTWWLGDLGGVVAVAPVVLMIRAGSPDWGELLRHPELVPASLLLLVTNAVAFGGVAPPQWAAVAAYVAFPCLVWAGIRLGTRGAVLAAFVTVAAATTAAAGGFGPFVGQDPQTDIITLWTYGIGVGTTGLALAAVAARNRVLEEQSRREQAERSRFEREQTLSKERERITREMHDGLGAQLVSVLSMIEHGRATPDEIAEVVRRSLDDMRVVMDSLDAVHTGFPESLGRLRGRIETVVRRNGVRFEWDEDGAPDLEALGPEESLHVLRILQETVANAIQHADAGQIEVEIGSTLGGRLRISVRDDGVGFVPNDDAPGRGIRNIRRRAEVLGATLWFEPADPGTRVVIEVPVELSRAPEP